ncbi:uncharacterized protein P884DRAFT_299272 [Thermothelomyces heterothallicus CBS 202.75]|uniref:uncharacterized protein n=1 Tax=Thermothelomyces heterothallicus CBS 202.75 TaxID=1149848 RepID=UPI0037427B30
MHGNYEATWSPTWPCRRARSCAATPDTFPGHGASLLWFDDFSKHPAYDRIVKTFEKLIREKPKPGFKRKRKTVAAN